MDGNPLTALERPFVRRRQLKAVAVGLVIVGIVATNLWLLSVGLWLALIGGFVPLGFGLYSLVRVMNGEAEPNPLPPGPYEAR